MDGKKIIVIVVVISVVGLIATWLWGESLIKKYDLERAMSTIQYVPKHLYHLLHSTTLSR